MAKDKLIYASAARKAILDADPRLAYCIDEIPGVDAVKVVRCKDCEFWEQGKDYEPYCNHWGNLMADSQADDFCSYGERKDGE